jgi:23S rRNA pseudouridine1911/1915/1917 synthase
MKRIALTIDSEHAGRRLDRFLADADPEISRSEVQRDIRAGRVSVSGEVTRQPSRRLRENDEVIWEIADRAPLTPRPIPLDVLYEDEHLVAVDKPAGLVVHPGAGTESPTLVEGLLADRTLPRSDDPARPGIVHRLDKETSGVILVAKTAAALAHLQRQFAARSVEKAYLAVVRGVIAEKEGTIDAPIGRDPAHPRRMRVRSQGRAARTDFRVLRRLRDSTLLLVRPHTGRTHQVRVHLQYIGHPVVGDSIYGDAKRGRPPQVFSDSGSRGPGQAAHDAQGRSAYAAKRRRMMLHAWRITVQHPETGKSLRLEAPVPPEFPDFACEESGSERRGETK